MLKLYQQISSNSLKQFLLFTVTWIANNLSIPFWVVGHVHLSLNVYHDVIEILSSLGMNIIVAIGFWIEYKAHVKELNNKQSGGGMVDATWYGNTEGDGIYPISGE